MPGTALWVDEFICLPLSPFICLPFSPSLDAWHGSLGGRVHLSPFLSPFICLLLSPSLDAWHGSLGGRVHLSPFVSLHSRMPGTALGDAWHGSLGGFMSPFVSLHLSPFVSQPGCLARLWVDEFICLPLSPFICLPFSPSLDAWHGSLGGRFVSPHLSPIVSQPGCLARLSGRTGSFLSLCLPSFVLLSPSLDAWHGSLNGQIHLSPLISLYLAPVGCLSGWTGLFASHCLSAWTSSIISLCLLLVVSQPRCVTDSCAVCSAGRHVCLRLRNACLSARTRARVRLIKPQAACFK